MKRQYRANAHYSRSEWLKVVDISRDAFNEYLKSAMLEVFSKNS